MSEPKLISPLLDNFIMGEPMSDHHGVRCYPAMNKQTDKRYIIKTISIPASQVQLDALLLAGAYKNQAAALAYFKELANGIADEVEVLKKLAKFEGYLPFENIQIVPMEGRFGYEVYLVSPYKRSLERFMRKNTMTHLKAVNLGLDLCASMVMCRRAGYLYTDLKPQNIFINEKAEFRVSDLGFVKLDSLKYASLPEKYQSPYSPPEVQDVLSSLNSTVDTYGIGMILYQVYNNGKLPETGVPLTAPAYADEEMSEIILKAIASDPAERWTDPVEMGQALVAYMQRNSVNDVPIAPPAPEPEITEEPIPEPVIPVITEEPAEETVSEEPEEETVSEEPVTEANAPEEAPAVEIPAEEVPDEEEIPEVEEADAVEHTDISDILAQVDDLIAHETPEPVVVPTEVEISISEPEEAEQVVEAEVETAEEEAEVPAEPAEEVTENETSEETAAPEAPVAVTEPEEIQPEHPKRKGWLGTVITVLLLLAAGFAGMFYYNNVYLQNIDALKVTEFDNTLIVTLDTKADESLLKVTCTDAYGNTYHSAVVDGKARFDQLNADTLYQISVSIDGFHELRGNISDSYTTPAQINIVRFEAIAGNDNGSVILNFTIDGKEPESWTVTYSAEGEYEQTVTFKDHLVNIHGLALNKEYTFVLSAKDTKVVGTDSVTFTPTNLAIAQNLEVTSLTEDGLTVVWELPEGETVENWVVHCYSNDKEDGYDQQLITTDTKATFKGVDPAGQYTIEVFADGMTVGNRTYVSEGSATITEFHVTFSDQMKLDLTWNYSGATPAEGWTVLYSINGGDQEVIKSQEASLSIYPTLPSAVYSFTVQSTNGTVVFCNTFETEVLPVDNFSGYNVTIEDMTFDLVKAPDHADWTHADLQNTDYTNTFTPGDNIGILIHLDKACRDSTKVIETLYVIRNEAGHVVSTSTSYETWNDMWYAYYCDQTIPEVPSLPGNYSLEIYFDGMFASHMNFTVSQ